MNVQTSLFGDIDVEESYIFDKDYEIREFEGDNPTGKIKEYPKQKEMFKIIITFKNEKEQEEYYNQFVKEGLDCRVLTF